MTRSPTPSLPRSRCRTGPDATRRALLGAALALPLVGLLPREAVALTEAAAAALVQRVVTDINRVIASGRTGSALYSDFERIFATYSDVRVIAGSVLGPVARTLSSSQQTAFIAAFQSYMARKYGRRFTEFKGGTVEVSRTVPVNNYVEVQSVARLPGRSPIDVSFLVSDRDGQNRFFDIRIEGVSLLRTERDEIGVMLDQRQGNIDRLIADLRTL